MPPSICRRIILFLLFARSIGDFLIHASLALTTRVWEFLGIKTQISDDFDSTPFVDPDTGEARSRYDLTFVTGLNVSF